MKITSLEHALEIYSDNLDWSNENQCKKALAALRYIQVLRPSSGGHLGSNLSWYDINGLIAELESKLKGFKRISWTRARLRRL